MHEDALIGGMIGLTAVMGTLLLILIIVIVENRSRRYRTKMLHDERMAALEKGLPIPMDYPLYQKRRRPYVRGLVFAAIGLGGFIWGIFVDENAFMGIGLICFLIGLALIIGDRLTASRERDRDRDAAAYPADYPMTQDNPSYSGDLGSLSSSERSGQ